MHHRHTMRRLLEGSVVVPIIAAVTGDVASASSGLDPRHLAALLKRIEEKAPGRGRAVPDFLPSHPSNEEREALALEPSR